MAAAETIVIAAALIYDDQGRVLLVRKTGTSAFMQPGGKIEPGEQPIDALRRELHEELGLIAARDLFTYIGRFEAAAANEPGCTVSAELFALRWTETVQSAAEIAELIWFDQADIGSATLAPLTRDHVLPLARATVPSG
jgi:8-oxo-dGTP pyrophosphatase MutT (NUDIX family)